MIKTVFPRSCFIFSLSRDCAIIPATKIVRHPFECTTDQQAQPRRNVPGRSSSCFNNTDSCTGNGHCMNDTCCAWCRTTLHDGPFFYIRAQYHVLVPLADGYQRIHRLITVDHDLQKARAFCSKEIIERRLQLFVPANFSGPRESAFPGYVGEVCIGRALRSGVLFVVKRCLYPP